MTQTAYFADETAVIDAGARIGAGTKIWHFCHVSGDAEIGERCVLGQNVFVANGTKIGNGCKLQNNVSIYTGVTLEDDVFCGPSMVFTNVINPRAFVERKHEFRKTLVQRGASIGANATIVCGVLIGRYAMIGAGAVLTKDAPDFALMVGVPASQRGWVCSCGMGLDSQLVCPGDGQGYTRVGTGLAPQGERDAT
jgi:UDP-2-acetamido-3-amino-2,3-dideoxy-glucuronate N-acetyltransferase